jgi:hypothetical protein
LKSKQLIYIQNTIQTINYQYQFNKSKGISNLIYIFCSQRFKPFIYGLQFILSIYDLQKTNPNTELDF